MHPTGIVKKLDSLGRLTIPRELREVLGLERNDSVKFVPYGTTVVIRRHTPAICIFCGSIEGMIVYKGKSICSECIMDLKVK